MHYYLSNPLGAGFLAPRRGSYLLWLCFRVLPAIIGGALMALLLCVSPARASLEGPGGSLAEPGAGHLRLVGDGSSRMAPVLNSQVHFEISGLIATARLSQQFRNDGSDWVEAIYAFPLPDNAAVRSMEIIVGERRIVGRIKEKSVARDLYQRAKKAGKKASLVEQQRPNLFTNRVANIGPGELITVELEYVQTVGFTGGEFSLRFPMTLTPRYMPGAPLPAGEEAEPVAALRADPRSGWAVATDQVPDAALISPYLHPSPGDDRAPHNPIAITASLDVGMPLASVESSYHELSMSRSAGRYHIELVGGVSEMDRDFVLNWRAVTGATPEAAVFSEEVEGVHYGLLMVVPPHPAMASAVQPLPRDVTFIIDTSGSMGGVAIAQARQSLIFALEQLGPQDRFNVIAFNSSVHTLYRAPVPASAHHRQRARVFVEGLEAGGGTEMRPALSAALRTKTQAEQDDGARLHQVVFITDGAVGNEQALFEDIESWLGDARLFTVAIGSAPNSWFMRKAAQFGRGSYVHIGDLGEVRQAMGGLFAQLAAPVARNVRIDWPAAVDAYPPRIPDLYRGEPLVVAFRSGEVPLAGTLRVEGTLAAGHWTRDVQVVPLADGEEARTGEGVASVWARRRIESLLDQRVSGTAEPQVREQVLPVALAHSLLSPYTSFVAVEERISRPGATPLANKTVANTQPRGQSPQAFAYPATATWGPASLFGGTLLLFLALMVYVMQRPEVDHVPMATA